VILLAEFNGLTVPATLLAEVGEVIESLFYCNALGPEMCGFSHAGGG
jgi:hypothetical protein